MSVPRSKWAELKVDECLQQEVGAFIFPGWELYYCDGLDLQSELLLFMDWLSNSYFMSFLPGKAALFGSLESCQENNQEDINLKLKYHVN